LTRESSPSGDSQQSCPVKNGRNSKDWDIVKSHGDGKGGGGEKRPDCGANVRTRSGHQVLKKRKVCLKDGTGGEETQVVTRRETRSRPATEKSKRKATGVLETFTLKGERGRRTNAQRESKNINGHKRNRKVGRHNVGKNKKVNGPGVAKKRGKLKKAEEDRR